MKKALVIYTHIVGLAVIRALGRMDVPVYTLSYSENEMGLFSKYVKGREQVPDPRKNEEDFISKLVELAQDFAGSLLIPTDDYTVVVLSKNKDLLKSHYVVAVEDWAIVQKLIEKQHTYKLARSWGIPSPMTFVVKSFDELRAFLAQITYPCLIKPCEGHTFFDHFKVKMFRIEDEEELFERYRQIEPLRFTVMIQELIPGDDAQGVNYNSYFVNGEPIAEFTAQKVRLEPPFLGSPRVLFSKAIPEILENGRLLLRNLNYSGFSCMEFKKDQRSGVYKLMEVNCRNNLSGSLAVTCGINFPWILYRHLMYDEVNRATSFKENVYWIDLDKDILRFFISHKEEGYSLKQYLQPYCKEKIFAILSADDPLPYVKRVSYLTKLLFRKIITSAKTGLIPRTGVKQS
jgi:predicted ATP-grasp superfamily ATP-dependent carboligase